MGARRGAARLACLLSLAGLAAPARGAAPAPFNLCADNDSEGRCPARVVLVREGWVVIEASRPLHVGDRFTLLSQRPVRGIDPATRREARVPEGETTGMLVLERVRGQQGAGRLVRNAYAEAGDLAVPTSAPYRESLVYGRRFPSTWRIHGDAWIGPLLGDQTGVGLVGTSAVEYRFRVPLKLALELGPLALVSGLRSTSFRTGTSMTLESGTVFSGSLRGVVGLALSGFELSAGIGGAVNTGWVPPGDLQMSVAARAGSLDGLGLTASFQFFLPVGSRRAAEFDSGVAAFHIPLHRRLTMALSAGGAPSWLYSTIGFRVYVQGTGGPGTWILGFGAGGGYMMAERRCGPPTTASLDCQEVKITGGGPLFHIGLDRRF